MEYEARKLAELSHVGDCLRLGLGRQTALRSREEGSLAAIFACCCRCLEVKILCFIFFWLSLLLPRRIDPIMHASCYARRCSQLLPTSPLQVDLGPPMR